MESRGARFPYERVGNLDDGLIKGISPRKRLERECEKDNG